MREQRRRAVWAEADRPRRDRTGRRPGVSTMAGAVAVAAMVVATVGAASAITAGQSFSSFYACATGTCRTGDAQKVDVVSSLADGGQSQSVCFTPNPGVVLDAAQVFLNDPAETPVDSSPLSGATATTCLTHNRADGYLIDHGSILTSPVAPVTTTTVPPTITTSTVPSAAQQVMDRVQRSLDAAGLPPETVAVLTFILRFLQHLFG